MDLTRKASCSSVAKDRYTHAKKAHSIQNPQRAMYKLINHMKGLYLPGQSTRGSTSWKFLFTEVAWPLC